MRLFYLQIIDGKKYDKFSKINYVRKQKIFPLRGKIFDRNGFVIVKNRPSFDLSIILEDAKPYKKTIKKLSKYTGLSKKSLLSIIKKKLRRRKAYDKILLKKDIDAKLLAVIKSNKLELPGIEINIKPIRFYIDPRLASHIIGYVGNVSYKEFKKLEFDRNDIIGKTGLEKKNDKLLRGKKGYIEVEVDARGRVIKEGNIFKSESGFDMALTIDKNLQKKMDELMYEQTGAMIAMNPQNGEILAIGSYPNFNLNEISHSLSNKKWQQLINDKQKPMFNKAIRGLYPPASVYKIVVAIAAIEEKIINDDFLVFCGGAKKYGNRRFRCWAKKGHGIINLNDAIIHSCDIFFYELGTKLGIKKIAKYAKLLGFGEVTGIDINGEAKGLVPTKIWKKKKEHISWYLGDTISAAIGQGYNLATPIQLTVLISALANGGKIVKPIIVKSIKDNNNKVIFENKTEIKELNLKPKTIEILRKSLFGVVNNIGGTAYNYRLPYDISGKTGTAQLISRTVQKEQKDKKKRKHLYAHSSFVAYAPSKKEAEIAIYTLIEHGDYNNTKAASFSMKLIKYYFDAKK